VICQASCLLVVLIFAATTTGFNLLHVLPLDATRSATTVWRLEGEINVLLAVQAHNVTGDVHNLLAHTDMSLPDEDTGVVDGLGEAELEDLGLETTLHEVLQAQTQHVIELHFALVEHADTHQTTQQSVTFKETLGVLLFPGQQLTGSGADFSQGVLDTPYLALVAFFFISSKRTDSTRSSRHGRKD